MRIQVNGKLASSMKVFQVWKEITQFSDPADWVLASPAQLGRLPWSYDEPWRVYQKVLPQRESADLVRTRSHTHIVLCWTALGTPLAVQQKLVHHTDIRTTMNVYGDVRW